MWIKALLAVAPAALFIAAPAPVHADGACTALASDYDAFNECIAKANAHCWATGNAWTNPTIACAYPDGGRDDCIWRLVPFGGGRTSGSTCTYVPAGSDPAPAADPAPAPAPGAEGT